jgi:hypothetical protein
MKIFVTATALVLAAAPTFAQTISADLGDSRAGGQANIANTLDRSTTDSTSKSGAADNTPTTEADRYLEENRHGAVMQLPPTNEATEPGAQSERSAAPVAQ